MTEKEILINELTNSFATMQQIESKEYEISQMNERIAKAKRFRYLLLMIVMSSVLGTLSMSIHPIFFFPVCGGIIAFYCIIRSTRISSAKSRIAHAQNEIARLCNSPELAWLPPAYRNSIAYNAISSYIANLRANTLQEAINLLELEIHRARVEIYSAGGYIS